MATMHPKNKDPTHRMDERHLCLTCPPSLSSLSFHHTIQRQLAASRGKCSIVWTLRVNKRYKTEAKKIVVNGVMQLPFPCRPRRGCDVTTTSNAPSHRLVQ
ncbi:unnamed protein product [Oppiella nova]|uniref:Uncharacterized protein n=1 Tax=Oppiella nova TaxID=334625 RepID=A0A7R9M2H4_9ACAR|nr:unnamed protein product [Oppiella nova]CAG2169586.1 unnamed protein product [Oppiella nova]